MRGDSMRMLYSAIPVYPEEISIDQLKTEKGIKNVYIRVANLSIDAPICESENGFAYISAKAKQDWLENRLLNKTATRRAR